MRYFEDLSVGEETIFEDEYLVTEDEIIEVGTRWDPQPFHIDPVAAKKSIFGGLVASSAHIFSIYVCIGNADVDKDKNFAAVTALGFDNLQWHAPVRPGDTLRNRFVITGIRESRSRPRMGIVTTRARLINQNDETVFTIEGSCLVERRPTTGREANE